MDTLIDYLLGIDPSSSPHPKSLFWHLAAAVLRVKKPGYKHDMSLMLEGPRGVGKSTLCKMLLPASVRDRWHVELSSLDQEDKRLREEMAGAIFVESPEMAGAGRADALRLKAIGSKTSWRGRMAYDRAATTWAIDAVIYGTTNSPALPFDPPLLGAGTSSRFSGAPT